MRLCGSPLRWSPLCEAWGLSCRCHARVGGVVVRGGSSPLLRLQHHMKSALWLVPHPDHHLRIPQRSVH